MIQVSNKWFYGVELDYYFFYGGIVCFVWKSSKKIKLVCFIEWVCFKREKIGGGWNKFVEVSKY